MTNDYLTPEQVATALSVSLETVYLWLRNKSLPGLKAGRLWRIRPEELRQFLERERIIY